MSSAGLTSGAQLRYILQWFGEFSELQREDFLPMLAAVSLGKPDQLATILEGLTCQDKPVSLFQCRIKLFNEWFPTWSEEEQHRLVKGISEMEPEFGKKLAELQTNGCNGDTYGTHSPELPIEEVAEEITENEEQNDSPILEDDKVQENTAVEISAVEIAAAS